MLCSVDSQQRLFEYVVIDVETTGLKPLKGARIIEIGAVSIKDGKIMNEFHSLLNVPKRISREAQSVHGITNEMLACEPTPEYVFPQFQDFIGDSTLVAHNAKFDMGFLRAEFHRLGLALANRYKCTLEMSRKHYPHLEDHSLASVYRFLFGELPGDIHTHRALEDARMAAMIWLKMTREFV